MYQRTFRLAKPPMRNEVSVPGIRKDRGKLPPLTGKPVGFAMVSGPNPGTYCPGIGIDPGAAWES